MRHRPQIKNTGPACSRTLTFNSAKTQVYASMQDLISQIKSASQHQRIFSMQTSELLLIRLLVTFTDTSLISSSYQSATSIRHESHKLALTIHIQKKNCQHHSPAGKTEHRTYYQQ